MNFSNFIKINVLFLIILLIMPYFSFCSEYTGILPGEVEQEIVEEEQEESKLDILATEKNDLENNLNNANNEIELVESQLSQELFELEELNGSILQYEQQIEIMKAEEDSLVDFITVAERELDKVTVEYIKLRSLLKRRLIAMYETSEMSYLDVLLNSKSISEFISNYYIIEQVASIDKNLLEHEERVKANVESIAKTLEDKNNRLIKNREESEKMKISLENMMAIKNSKVLKLSEEEMQLHQKISEYQEQILALEKEIKLLSIASVGSEYIGGVMAWPVPGYTRITSQFGMRTHPITGVYKLHTGVDIGAPIGSTFIAANDGVVVKAEYNLAYGNMVIIDHGGGVTTLYAHGSEILVEVGQVVTQGTPVLLVGSTGYSTGPHAHFEVRINGEYLNPLDYITSYNTSDTTENSIIEIDSQDITSY